MSAGNRDRDAPDIGPNPTKHVETEDVVEVQGPYLDVHASRNQFHVAKEGVEEAGFATAHTTHDSRRLALCEVDGQPETGKKEISFN